jgi:hypothetical protein
MIDHAKCLILSDCLQDQISMSKICPAKERWSLMPVTARTWAWMRPTAAFVGGVAGEP